MDSIQLLRQSLTTDGLCKDLTEETDHEKSPETVRSSIELCERTYSDSEVAECLREDGVSDDSLIKIYAYLMELDVNSTFRLALDHSLWNFAKYLIVRYEKDCPHEPCQTNVNFIDEKTGDSALHEAVNTDDYDLELIELLLQKMKNPGIKNKRQQTALHLAQSPRVVALLMRPSTTSEGSKKYFDINDQDIDGRTLLHYACLRIKYGFSHKFDLEYMQDLIKVSGAKPAIKDRWGYTFKGILKEKEKKPYFKI
jgi:ankyrin repeat protein